MINDVGKTTAIIRLNDYVINMVNATIPMSMTSGIRIFDEGLTDNLRYTLSISEADHRCLMFSRSFSGDAIDNILRPVLYVPPSVVDVGTHGVTCIPLYECISPSIGRLVNGNYQLTWWSNMDSMPETDPLSGKYVYDYASIRRFKTSELGDVESSETACKILCTAPVHWEKLRMEGYDGAQGSTRTFNTPLIRDIAILAAISGEGYIVDFSTGSGGGGNKIHSHLNTQDCGFAGAVFMPSATPRVMSWM